MKMKHLNKAAAVVLILIGSVSAKAQSTATATATATIVTPITVTKVNDMNFGNVAVDATFGGTVTLTPANPTSRTALGNVSLPATTGTVSAAQFLVSGNSGFTYSILLPVDITLVHSGGIEVMTADNLTSTPSGTGTLTGGTESVFVGATLNVVGGQTSGVYSGTFDVTVNYN
jgi:hypothetical protein